MRILVLLLLKHLTTFLQHMSWVSEGSVGSRIEVQQCRGVPPPLWFCEVKTLADELDIAVSNPRITGRQVHHANIPADSPEVYCRRKVMIPFLDHITTELESSFELIHQTKVNKSSWPYTIRCC